MTRIVTVIYFVLLFCFTQSVHGLVKFVDVTITLHTCNTTCPTTKQNCESKITIDGHTEIMHAPGIQFMVFTQDTGQLVYNVAFDYLSNRHQTQRLKHFLKEIPPSSVVIIIAHKQCQADVKGWYNLIQNFSTLDLADTALIKDQSAAPDMVITCQDKCGSGGVSETSLPMYRKQETNERTALKEQLTLFFGKTGTSLQSAVDGEEADDEEKKKQKLFLIVLCASLFGVFFLFLLMVLVIRWYKQRLPSRDQKAKEEQRMHRLKVKVHNWLQQRKIEDINREFSHCETPSHQNYAYRGDVVRYSISTPSLPEYRHNYTPDVDNFSMTTYSKVTTLQRANNDNFHSIATLSTTAYDSEGYLTPIDFMHARHTHRDHMNLSRQFSVSSDFSSVSQRYAPFETFYVRELKHDEFITPNTSRKIFTTNATASSTGENNEGIGSSEIDEKRGKEDGFAQYCRFNSEGPIYKIPSNVIHYDPPLYDPAGAPQPPSQQGEEEDNYETFLREQNENKRKSYAPLYEVATKV